MKFLLFILLLCGGEVFAFESYPEFRSLLPREAEKLEVAENTDSEYSSDVLTYRASFADHYFWLANSNGFRLNLGSLSGKHFLIDNQLKMDKSISSRWDFRFTYLEQGDFGQDEQHAIIELIHWWRPGLGLSLYGAPAFRKSADDIGLAYIFRPVLRHEVRIFHTWVDFSRNQRNEDPDRFIEDPKAFGVVARMWSPSGSEETEFIELAYRYETHARWHLPEEDRLYGYNRRYASFSVRQPIRDSRDYFNFRTSLRQKHESEGPDSSSSSVDSQKVESDWSEFILQREMPIGKSKWLAGVERTDRRWLTTRGNVSQRTWSPHLWWHYFREKKGRQRTYSLGYEISFYEGEGLKALRASTDKNRAVEHRLNVGFQFHLFDQGMLRLLFTFDLDRFGSGETWEGGAGQFFLPF